MRRCWQASPSFCCPGSPRGFVSLHAKSPNAYKNFYFAVCSGCQSGIRIGRPEGLLTGKAAGKPHGKTPPCAADLIYYVPLRGGTGLPAGTGRSLPAVIRKQSSAVCCRRGGHGGNRTRTPQLCLPGLLRSHAHTGTPTARTTARGAMKLVGRPESNRPSDAGGIKTAALLPEMYEPAPGPQSLFLIFWNSGHSDLDPILIRKDLRHDLHQALYIKHTLLPFPISWDICTHGLIIFSRCDTITSGRR